MEQNRFFQGLWRFNAVVISLVGILAVLVMCMVLWKIVKDATRSREVDNIVQVEQPEQAERFLRLGNMDKVEGHSIVKVPLYTDQTFNRDYFSKNSTSIVNYLFIDAQSKAKHWLLDESGQLIKSTDELRFGGYNSKQPAVAIMYQVVKLDSNGDNLLTRSDQSSIAFSKPDGHGYKEVLVGLETFLGSEMLNSNTVMLMFEKGGQAHVAEVDLMTFEVTHTEVIPLIGK